MPVSRDEHAEPRESLIVHLSPLGDKPCPVRELGFLEKHTNASSMSKQLPAIDLAGYGREVLAAATGQRDRKFRQGHAARPSQNPGRSRQLHKNATASGHERGRHRLDREIIRN